MKPVILYALFLMIIGNLFAQEKEANEMVKKGYTIKLAINIPSENYGIIPNDEYLEPQHTRPGFGLDFGRLWFFTGKAQRNSYFGLDATFLSLNYMVVKGENKIDGVTGQMIYKYDYRHISISTNIGPSYTFLWNSDLATDISLKFAPTLNYFYYQHSVDIEYYKNPNVQLGIALKFHPAINLRYKEFLFGLEYSYGSAAYTDFRDYNNPTQTNDLNIELNMLRVIIGFKL